MTRRYVVTLACLCTLVAVLLSVAGAWSRAGLPVERALFAAVAVLLTVGAHVIPALCRDDQPVWRVLAGLLWLACMVAVVAGHLAFFAGAERHAGQLRVSEMPRAVRSAITARPLSEVAADLGAIRERIARLQASLIRCPTCQTENARLNGLQARREALETEEAEARRRITLEDAADARMQSALTDPAAGRAALMLGVSAAAASLIVGTVSAVVLELLGCLLWVKACARGSANPASHARSSVERHAVTAPVTATDKGLQTGDVGAAGFCSDAPVMAGHGADPDALAVIRDGIKPTVNAIRQHLKCSQARAAAIRRMVVEGDAA
ncbi:hypothetical protein [Ralstonia sp.]|uniref:hypothetical protein n=1 Tax=Ralstonia sp. TaxID=54061 RepID=UPI0031DF1D30